jgi:CheY-like chemotaxis protein
MNTSYDQTQGEGAGGSGRALVLAVDDEPIVLTSLREALTGLPIRLRCLESAEEALEAMYAELPAAVVSDYRMPGMSGLELLLRVQTQWPEVRLALHTSDPMAQSRAARLRIPFLAKGALPEEVRDLVTGLVQN